MFFFSRRQLCAENRRYEAASRTISERGIAVNRCKSAVAAKGVILVNLSGRRDNEMSQDRKTDDLDQPTRTVQSNTVGIIQVKFETCRTMGRVLWTGDIEGTSHRDYAKLKSQVQPMSATRGEDVVSRDLYWLRLVIRLALSLLSCTVTPFCSSRPHSVAPSEQLVTESERSVENARAGLPFEAPSFDATRTLSSRRTRRTSWLGRHHFHRAVRPLCRSSTACWEVALPRNAHNRSRLCHRCPPLPMLF